jgi:hypothetical protein
MKIKVIRMWSGEDVVTELVEEKEESIVLRNPIVAVPTGQQGQVGFAPWAPFIKGKDEDVEVTKKYVIFIAETQEQVEDQYRQMFSNIVTPSSSSKKIIL